MEVHHHSHSEGKRLKHYLFEFFMLFLAVFCGFLAENFREHIVEHRREVQYMRSLKEDVEKDVAEIETNLPQYNTTLNNIDSIRARFGEIINDKPTVKTITLISDVLGFPDFVYTDRTIQQLKNAGNMRLIGKSDVADSITQYDALVRKALIHQDILNSIVLNGLISKLKYVCNYDILENLRTGTPDKEKEAQMIKDVLLVHDKTELTRLLNEYIIYKIELSIHYSNVQKIKKSAEGVLNILKSEYHLN